MGPLKIRQIMNWWGRSVPLSDTVFSSRLKVEGLRVQHQWQFRGPFATASQTPTVFQASTGGHAGG